MTSTSAYPRLVIAAPHGRSGKTTVAIGLCAALAARTMAVQPFKKGPDYIDPSWLTEAAGRPCRSLDPFFLPGRERLQAAFCRGAADAVISVIEGNHGLYDSLDEDGSGSTAAVARYLAAPVLLVVDGERMGRSAAALVMGFQHFEPETAIAGVILNDVAQSRHEARLRSAIEGHCGLPVLGALPRHSDFAIPDRHLGLVPRGEDQSLAPAVTACRDAATRYLDLDAIIRLAQTAPALAAPDDPGRQATASPAAAVRIGVLRDRAFSFYYPENLDALNAAGAALIFIDSLQDTYLPPLDALYIGGGFPEMFMDELAANRSLREDVRRAATAGLSIYAECGGLMYLARHLRWGERVAEMAGVLPCDVDLLERPQGHGYVLAEALPGNPFFPAGTRLRGHEHHHSQVVGLPASVQSAYRLERGRGIGEGRDGIVVGNVLAAYTHLHAGGSPEWASALVRRARSG